MTKRTNLILTAVIALMVLITVIIGLDLAPMLRGGFGWRWPYDPVSIGRVLPLISSTAVFLRVAFWLLQRNKAAWPVLLWSVLGALMIALTTAYARDGDALYALFSRTASAHTTGPHWAATQIDWQSNDWQHWTDVMARLGGHLGTSPPGLPMFYGLLNDGLDATPGVSHPVFRALLPYQCHNLEMLAYSPAEWASIPFGMFMPLWAGLAVFPLYSVTRRVIPDCDVRLVAVWWALTPGLAGFSASWNTVYPLLSLIAFDLLVRGLRAATAMPERKSPVMYFAAAGLACGTALFMHFTFVPLLGLFGFYVLGHFWIAETEHGTAHIYRAVLVKGIYTGLWFAVGLIIPWAAFWLLGGDSVVEILQASLAYHLDLDRPYWFWVGMHVWDWLLWTGLGLALLWLVGVFHWLRSREGQPPLLGMALILTILILTFSGTTRGESGRIWLFLSPFVLIAALDGLNRISRMALRPPLMMLTAGHAGLMLVLVANLAAMGTDFTRPQSLPPAQMALNGLNTGFSTQAEGAVSVLNGWYAEQDGENIILTTQWQRSQPMTEVYYFGALLVGPDGTTTDAVIWLPGEARNSLYPTTCWAEGEQVAQTVSLPLPEDAESGDWWISLAMFGDDTHLEGRLQVTGADGSEDVQVGLGPVVVR